MYSGIAVVKARPSGKKNNGWEALNIVETHVRYGTVYGHWRAFVSCYHIR